MDKKAQALIEFVLILPVLIMLIFIFLDIGRIYVKKSELETIASNVTHYLEKHKDASKDDISNYIRELNYKNINIERLEKDEEYITVKFSSNVALITPGINLILGNDYKASVERVISNE